MAARRDRLGPWPVSVRSSTGSSGMGLSPSARPSVSSIACPPLVVMALTRSCAARILLTSSRSASSALPSATALAVAQQIHRLFPASCKTPMFELARVSTRAAERLRITWSNGSVVFIVFGLYITVLTVALIVLGVGIEPDRYFFILLLPVLLMGRARRYLMDWVPFLLLLFSYEFLRGMAPILGAHVHYLFSIRTDSLVFSTVPTVALQSWFYHPGSPHVS